MSILLGILEEGLIYAILALGVYITYSILDFPDLCVNLHVREICGLSRTKVIM